MSHLYILSEERKKSIEERIIKGVVGSPGIMTPTAPKQKLIIPKTKYIILLKFNFEKLMKYNCTICESYPKLRV
tara:strand:- start:2623 stop:2844 length:222 start_codon:yes stop_codon:yes gene_type:complete